jgi:surfeit locus 1 family protein
MNLRFSPGWKMTLFTALLLPLLLMLGSWQLDREAEKIQLQALHETRTASAPVPVDVLNWQGGDIAYQPVTMTGHFDNERYLLLDNRIQEGRVGYEVMMPFTTSSGQSLIVNRGWVAQGVTREQLPAVMPVQESVTISGSVYVPISEPFLLSDVQEAQTNDWPRVVQKIDVNAWSKLLQTSLLPHTVRISQNSPGALTAQWPTVNMEPEKHRGYAVQWFSMAAALLLMYIYFGIRRTNSKSDDE